nr:MAG TPA: hypothetical protein [Caudoviricetes sp.]
MRQQRRKNKLFYAYALPFCGIAYFFAGFFIYPYRYGVLFSVILRACPYLRLCCHAANLLLQHSTTFSVISQLIHFQQFNLLFLVEYPILKYK